MSTMNEEVDPTALPQSVQNTLGAWTWLNQMAEDKTAHPTLAAEIREAKAYMERDLWKQAAEQLAKPNLQSVPNENADEG